MFGIRTAEELKYQVIEKDSSFEIRQYEPYISAEVTLEGNYRDIQGDLFRILAGYIFGKNQKKQKISMTTPVVMGSEDNKKSEKIAMTAPVHMRPQEGNRWTMAFSMPNKYSMDTLPEPLDQRVQLREVNKKIFAVIRFSGAYDNIEKRMAKAKKLEAWLSEKNKYKKVGTHTFAGYDPPFTLPFLRRNEVMIEIKNRL
ncbi:MAG: heme-binding protein [Pseudomonadota bacterium]